MRIQDVEKGSSLLVVWQNMLTPAKYQLPYQVANPQTQNQC